MTADATRPSLVPPAEPRRPIETSGARGKPPATASPAAAHPRVTLRVVRSAFHAWKNADDAIHALEDMLKAPPGPEATASRADEINAEIRELRARSDKLLVQAQNALMTLKTPRVSQVDPTQY